MFPDQAKMKTGTFKICFIGILGVAENDMPQIKNRIHKHNPPLGTHDVVTCIELGVDHKKKMFDFDSLDNVTVIRDVLRQALVNQTGVLIHCSIDGSQMRMANVLEKDIRQVTRGSTVEVIHNTSPLYKCNGIAREDGSLCGWCCVEIDSKSYTIPTMWVKTVRAQEPENSKWESKACVEILYEQVVPTHMANTRMHIKADGMLDVAGLIEVFDPDSTVTPEIFAAFDTSLGDWSDQAQKDAVVDSICEQHASNPLHYFNQESITPVKWIYFNWEGCSGTQSVFSCQGTTRFYVDNTNPGIRSQALVGWYSCALGAMHWEIERQIDKYEEVKGQDESLDRQIDKYEEVKERDEGLLVENSFVAHRYDYTRRGRILQRMNSTRTCLVRWNQTVDGVSVPDGTPVEEALANLERSVFTMQVVMPPGLLHGFVEDYEEHPPPAYVYVTFYGNTSISEELGGAWFALKQLDKQRLRHLLQVYLSYPWRTARFFVQERVGVSIRSIANGQSELIIRTSSALCNLRQAMAFFCRGAARMHRENILHNDLHIGNLTITQTADGESFSVKMIDFDRMQTHAPSTLTVQFRRDLHYIVKGFESLMQNVQCSSLYISVERNHASEVLALLHWVYKMCNEVAKMSPMCAGSESADMLTRMATDIVGTRKRPLSP